MTIDTILLFLFKTQIANTNAYRGQQGREMKQPVLHLQGTVAIHL